MSNIRDMLEIAGHGNTPQPVNYDIVPGNVEGVVAVQVNGDGTLSLEIIAGARDVSSFHGFSGAPADTDQPFARSAS